MTNTVLQEIPKEVLASHFHNTYDRAIKNLVVSLSKGISVIDSSVAGIGGCQYAKGASGNIATEDVLYMCELLGIEHGVDFEAIIEIGDYISKELNRENLSKVSLEDLSFLNIRRRNVFGKMGPDGHLKPFSERPKNQPTVPRYSIDNFLDRISEK